MRGLSKVIGLLGAPLVLIKQLTCSPSEEMTFIILDNQSTLDRHLAAHEYWKASQSSCWQARMFADDQIYLHLFKNSKNPDIECLQNLPTTFSWSLTPLSGTSWLSSYLYLTSPNPKSTPTPQGSYPNPAQTHILGPCLWNPSHFVSVPSASKSLLEIEAPMARHSAWQSHDNSGSLGCWMLIELNKQISVTWIGHHFQGVQIWVLRRLACYGVGLQGRGNESPVQVAPRELRDGFSSAPGSPLHSHF